jgi:hypothetical protein
MSLASVETAQAETRLLESQLEESMAQTKSPKKTGKTAQTRTRAKKTRRKISPKKTSRAKKAPQPKAVVEISEIMEQKLPSGRILKMRLVDGVEQLEIRSAKGPIEVSIRLTDEGPVLCFSGESVAVSAATLSFQADKLSLNSTDKLEICSGGDLILDSKTELRLKGKMIHIN